MSLDIAANLLDMGLDIYTITKQPMVFTTADLRAFRIKRSWTLEQMACITGMPLSRLVAMEIHTVPLDRDDYAVIAMGVRRWEIYKVHLAEMEAKSVRKYNRWYRRLFRYIKTTCARSSVV